MLLWWLSREKDEALKRQHRSWCNFLFKRLAWEFFFVVSHFFWFGQSSLLIFEPIGEILSHVSLSRKESVSGQKSLSRLISLPQIPTLKSSFVSLIELSRRGAFVNPNRWKQMQWYDKFDSQTKRIQPFILELARSCIININQSMFACDKFPSMKTIKDKDDDWEKSMEMVTCCMHFEEKIGFGRFGLPSTHIHFTASLKWLIENPYTDLNCFDCAAALATFVSVLLEVPTN